jgi:hypothetical protein
MADLLMDENFTSRKWWWVLADKRGRLVLDVVVNGVGFQPALYLTKSDADTDAASLKHDGYDVKPVRIKIDVGAKRKDQ